MKKQMNQLSESSLMKLNKSVLVKEFKRMQQVVKDPVDYVNVYRDFTKEKLVSSLLDLYDEERKLKTTEETDEQLRRLEEGDPHDRALGKYEKKVIERKINPYIYLVDRGDRKPKSKRCKIVLSQFELNVDLEPVIGIGLPDEFYTYTFPEKLHKKTAKLILQEIMRPGVKWSLRHEDSLLHDFNDEYTELWIPRQLNNELDGYEGRLELIIFVTKKGKYLLELKNRESLINFKINQKDVLFLTEQFQIDITNE